MLDLKNSHYQEPIVIVEVAKLSLAIVALYTVVALIKWSIS